MNRGPFILPTLNDYLGPTNQDDFVPWLADYLSDWVKEFVRSGSLPEGCTDLEDFKNLWLGIFPNRADLFEQVVEQLLALDILKSGGYLHKKSIDLGWDFREFLTNAAPLDDLEWQV